MSHKQHVRRGRLGRVARQQQALAPRETPTQVWNETEKRWDKV